MSETRVAAAADLKPGALLGAAADGRKLVLCRDGTSVRALDGVCPHRGGPLAEGFLQGGCVVCPWHGWAFDVKTGRYTGAPGVGLRTYPAATRDDGIFVEG